MFEPGSFQIGQTVFAQRRRGGVTVATARRETVRRSTRLVFNRRARLRPVATSCA